MVAIIHISHIPRLPPICNEPLTLNIQVLILLYIHPYPSTYMITVLWQLADASYCFPTRQLVIQSITRSWLGVVKDQLTPIIFEFLLCQYHLPLPVTMVTSATLF